MSVIIIGGGDHARSAIGKLELESTSMDETQRATSEQYLAKIADFIASAVTHGDYSKLEAVCGIC
jgi:hypothetical protein